MYVGLNKCGICWLPFLALKTFFLLVLPRSWALSRLFLISSKESVKEQLRLCEEPPREPEGGRRIFSTCRFSLGFLL